MAKNLYNANYKVKVSWYFNTLRRALLNEERCYRDSIKLLWKLSYYDIQFLKYHKIITAIAYILNRCGIELSDILEFKLRRYYIYYKELIRVSTVFNECGIGYVVIKTYRRTPKDIGDLDILIRENEVSDDIAKLLSSLGFKRRHYGTDEQQWSKNVEGIIVDLDLHTEISASSYIYYNKTLAFCNAIKSPEGVIIPHPFDNILITVSHSIMKDLQINISDLLEIYMLIKTESLSIRELLQYARNVGHGASLLLYITLIHYLLDSPDNTLQLDHLDINEPLYNFIIRNISFRSIVPRPRLPLVLIAYLNNALSKFRNENPFDIINQIINVPKGKGIKILVDYILRAKPKVKELWE